ncbi:hypothetical protein BDW67DRAFT_162478 [Aspergillus spinulosporus]
MMHTSPQVNSWNAELQTPEVQSDSVWSVAFSANGQKAVSGSRDCSIRLWNTQTGLEIRTLEGYSPDLISGLFSRHADYRSKALGSFRSRLGWPLEAKGF